VTVKLSVITPTFNGASILAEGFAALAAQETDFAWEMVCADNGSTDDTLAELERWAERFPAFRVVDATAERGVGFARNRAVAASSGQFLVFIDQDDVARPGYLAAMAAALEKHDLVAARMDGKALNPGGQVDRIIQVDGIPITFDRFPAASGGSMGIRRELFDRLGGFDTTVGVSDDVDLCWRAQLLGHPIEFVPDAVLMYRFRSTVGSLYGQGLRYGQAHSIMTRRYAKIFHQRADGPERAVTPLRQLARMATLRRGALLDTAMMIGWRIGMFRARNIPVRPLELAEFPERLV
jgi:GT2 family glycosyltransferase